jgi:hypothetical protein
MEIIYHSIQLFVFIAVFFATAFASAFYSSIAQFVLDFQLFQTNFNEITLEIIHYILFNEQTSNNEKAWICLQSKLQLVNETKFTSRALAIRVPFRVACHCFRKY